MQVVRIVVAALVGVPAGAMLNLVIDRVPSKARLRGPLDGEAQAPVSWIGIHAQPWLLRPRRASAGPMPRRWLWVELVTATLFGLLAARYADVWVLVPLLVLAASLVAVSVVDLQLKRIPDRITFPTLAASLPLVGAVSVHEGAASAITAALVGSACYFLVLFVTHLVYPPGMGFGDVKLALVMGLYLGWLGWSPDDTLLGPTRLVLYGLMLGCALGVVFGLTQQVVSRRRAAFPFGPALAAGCLVVVLFAADLRG